MMAGLIKNAKKINVWAFCNQKKNRSLAHFTVFFSGWANMLSFGWSSRGRFINGGGALSGRSKPPQNDPFGDWYFFFARRPKRGIIWVVLTPKKIWSPKEKSEMRKCISACVCDPQLSPNQLPFKFAMLQTWRGELHGSLQHLATTRAKSLAWGVSTPCSKGREGFPQHFVSESNLPHHRCYKQHRAFLHSLTPLLHILH